MTTSKSSSKSSSFNESSFLSRSRASSFSVNSTSSHPDSQIFSQQYNPRIILSSHFDQIEEELGAPINIYHENRGCLEEDKKARTDLDTDILSNDLYCPVQRQESEKTSSRSLNIGKFASLFPRFSFSNNYDDVMESTNTETWYHNDMFNINNMYGNFEGINGVACK
ncbi:hypothetical protein RclHR1_00170002 [Rhizophagus clarus]|nr:hypothetical protein RclHR1_00170002 [Rhizophagus clarus]